MQHLLETLTPTAPANGHAPAPSALSALPAGVDWRHAALADALRCREQDGSAEYALIRCLRERNPAWHARNFCENRGRVLAALAELLPDLAPCLAPGYCGGADEEPRPMYGWWRGTRPEDGHAYEIALTPSYYGDGDWVLAGESDAGVNALAAAVIEHATRHTTRCLLFSGGNWADAPQIQAEVDRASWDEIVLAPELLGEIRTAVDGFFGQKDLYHRMGFAWRRGLLLVGPPGTGKTMVCKAAARAHASVPFLYVRDLRGPGCADTLASIFARARRLAPCILAIEDLDGLVNDENRTMFLNELDGFRNNDGLLVIASSNHPERIDEALLKRPSRFDRVYHIGLPGPAERAEYVRRLLIKLPCPSEGLDAADAAERVAVATDGFTPAFLKEAVVSALLARVQNGAERVGAEFAEDVLAQARALREYLKKASNPAALSGDVGASGGIGFRPR